MNRKIAKSLWTITIVASTLGLGGPAFADSSSSAAGDAEVDYSKQFDQMIERLDKYLKTSKRTLYKFDTELPKLAKRLEMANYRITAALERYQEQKLELSRAESAKESTSKLDKIRSKMMRERKLLTDDASKLSTLIQRADEMRAEMQKMAPELKRLSDDVAIEADRFDPEDRRQKHVAQLLADTEWANGKIEELRTSLQEELSEPATQAVEQTKVD